jgi:curved DNA-binding protein CbpA
MTFQGDPYRTLGLVPGASLNDIRSAYRRLVKQYHPDAAGERALPRFLAIQAAYEHLVDGEGRLRPSRPNAGPSPRGREPWRADPARARASRDAWRARRGGGAGGPGGASTSGPSPTGAGAGGAGAPGDGSGRGPSRARQAGGGRPGGGRPDGGQNADGPPRERHGRRGPRKATPGSTTYDEAADVPLDPAWAGGAWYGPSSGTFWTINPREYADPRKHGPEYLERARRANDAAPGPDGTDADARWRWRGAGHSTTTDDGGAEWGTRAWTGDPGDPAVGDHGDQGDPGDPGDPAVGTDERSRGAAAHPGPDRPMWPSGTSGAAAAGPAAGDAWGGASTARSTDEEAADATAFPDLEALARRAAPHNLLELASRADHRWRLVLILAAWPPIGYLVGTLLATMTGCTSLSGSCPQPLPLLPLAVQPVVIVGLALEARVVAVAAFASLAAFAAAVPATAVLAVATPPDSGSAAWALSLVVGIAYLFGLMAAAVAIRGPAPVVADPPDPVVVESPGPGGDLPAP